MDIWAMSGFVHSLHVHSQSTIRQLPKITTWLENPWRHSIILDGELFREFQTIQVTRYTRSTRINNWWMLHAQHS
jgi:hypothetical protein